MENIKKQFARLYMELDLTDDQAAMINKLQRDVEAALRKGAVMPSLPSNDEVLQTFHQAERALLRMAPSGEDPNAEEVYTCLEVMRDWLLSNEA